MISVIIPAYNCEKYIERCLESIKNQIYSDLEIIVVDDGSTDRTALLIDRFKKKLPNLNYYWKKNGGVSSARNFGIEHASGEIIAFIDADDYISETYFMNIMNQFKNGVDVVVSNYKYIYENKDQSTPQVRIYPDFIMSLLSNDSILGFVFNKAYKRSVIAETRFDSEIKIYEDLLFNISIAERVKKFVFLEDNYYMYCQNQTSAMHTIFDHDESRLLAEKRIIDKLLEYNVKGELLSKRLYYFIWDYQLFCLIDEVKNTSLHDYYNKCCNLFLKQRQTVKQIAMYYCVTRFPKLFFKLKNNFQEMSRNIGEKP